MERWSAAKVKIRNGKRRRRGDTKMPTTQRPTPNAHYPRPSTLDTIAPGFTIIEVLVAIFIFAIVLAGVTQMLRSAEKVRMRSKRVSSATVVAANEAERIRKKARYHETIGDSTYTRETNGVRLRVHRSVVARDAVLPPAPPLTQEVAITVVAAESTDPWGVESADTIVSFRLLQGYEQ